MSETARERGLPTGEEAISDQLALLSCQSGEADSCSRTPGVGELLLLPAAAAAL